MRPWRVAEGWEVHCIDPPLPAPGSKVWLLFLEDRFSSILACQRFDLLMSRTLGFDDWKNRQCSSMTSTNGQPNELWLIIVSGLVEHSCYTQTSGISKHSMDFQRRRCCTYEALSTMYGVNQKTCLNQKACLGDSGRWLCCSRCLARTRCHCFHDILRLCWHLRFYFRSCAERFLSRLVVSQQSMMERKGMIDLPCSAGRIGRRWYSLLDYQVCRPSSPSPRTHSTFAVRDFVMPPPGGTMSLG